MPAVQEVLPGLPEAYLAWLDADIRDHGVNEPILVTSTGEVIDGVHRLKIASKYGHDVPKRELTVTPERADEIRVQSRIRREGYTTAEKVELVRRLMADCGWSKRRACDAVGIPERTYRDNSVAGIPATELQRREGKDGRKYQPRRFKPDEIQRRREAVRALADQGCNDHQVAQELGIGVGTAHSDMTALRATGYQRPKVTRPVEYVRPPEWRDAQRERQPAPKPATVPKLAPEPKPHIPQYLSSMVAQTIKGHMEYLATRNGVVQLAYDIKDARAAGDESWVAQVDEDLRNTADYVARLRRLVSDAAYLTEVLDTQYHRDDVRIPRHEPPVLRAVE